MPWDEQFLIESLSDSTIYMAYYTVAHILQVSMAIGWLTVSEVVSVKLVLVEWMGGVGFSFLLGVG